MKPHFFIYSPGDSDFPGGDEAEKEINENLQEGAEGAAEEGTSFIKKIKDALQEWSNQDQQQQDLDDTLPVT